MFHFPVNSLRARKRLAVLLFFALSLAVPFSAGADKKKKKTETEPPPRWARANSPSTPPSS